MLSATWGRWEVEGRGVPELLPWVAEGGDRCFALVADFEVRFKSLRQSQVVLKACNIAKKIRCNLLKEGGDIRTTIDADRNGGLATTQLYVCHEED